MRTSTLLIGSGVWLAVGALVAALSNTPVVRPAEPAAAADGGLPSLVVLAGRRISAPVDPVGTEPGGALALPADVRRVGWWTGGALPSDVQGTVVLAGHVDDSTGRGAFFALRDVAAGDRVEITAGRTTVAYAVTGVARYRKQALPADLFTTTGPPRLALITCGGPFDSSTGHYRDNIVVLATPAPTGQ
ncbi:class F sortase [Hamadaea tsunoensis]|uniref:class F sortase n=1 Tax=Hamadaea tsunoensis TaxID=53368 RepID=UPI000411914E|nr:class F sortase [Hamadaea tsunoensis]